MKSPGALALIRGQKPAHLLQTRRGQIESEAKQENLFVSIRQDTWGRLPVNTIGRPGSQTDGFHEAVAPEAAFTVLIVQHSVITLSGRALGQHGVKTPIEARGVADHDH